MARLKQRLWLYMDMTYFRSVFGFRRLRFFTYVLAPILALTWVVVAAVRHDDMPYSSGEMSAMHGHFAHDCAQCHFEGWAGLMPRLDKERGMNQRCLSCHGSYMGHDMETASAWHAYTGAEHRATQEATVGCNACHLEHQGKDTLVQVPDAGCTSCHVDLGPSLGGRAPRVVSPEGLKIRSFEPDGGHPEFKMWQPEHAFEDPGTIAFSHHFHMMPTDYDPQSRILVDAGLKCADCHRAGDTAQPWRFASQTREAHREDFRQRGHSEPDSGGAFMTPVRYALHCASCHQLAADPRLTGSRSVPDGAVPHERPEVVRVYLVGQLTAYAMRTDKDALAWPDGRVPLPRRLDAPEEDEQARLAWVQQETERIERQLYKPGGLCLKCHQLERPHVETAPAPPEVKDHGLPRRWALHSSFDHSVHRAELDCLGCHPQAADAKYRLERWDGVRAGGSGRDGAEVVMMPKMETCRECHSAPRREADGRRAGGIVATCGTCHTYHRPQLVLEPAADGASGEAR